MDIYFLTNLLRHGAPLSLSSFTRGGDSARDYIRRYCREGSQPSRDSKINIRDVTDRSLRTILFTFARLAGSAALHVANRSYMQYTLEWLEPKVFNWCDAVLPVMKEQLTKVKSGKSNNFGHGSIFMLSPWKRSHWCSRNKFHLAYLHQLSHECRDGSTLWPNMLVSPRFPSLVLSSSGSTVKRWFFPSIHMLVWISRVTRIWCCRLVSSGVLFINSLNIFLFIISFYNFLALSSIMTNQNSCAHADIGPVRPAVRLRVLVAAPTGEVVGRAILRDLDVAETLLELQD